MFELSVARKYLVPRWRQLSVSVISVISVLVIALVVWLIVVFFSVTNGLEKFWIGKFVSLAAPIRVTPTDAFYRSYYYQVDSISDASDYHHKSLGEKLIAAVTDPYDPDVDQEMPSHWPPPDRKDNGEVKDLVKEAVEAIRQIPGVVATTYETTFGNIRLRLARGASHRARNFRGDDGDQAFLAQATIIGSLEAENPDFKKSLLPLRGADVSNIIAMAGTAASTQQTDGAEALRWMTPAKVRERLRDILSHLSISALTPAADGWMLPKPLLPETGTFQAAAVLQRDRVLQLIVPADAKTVPLYLEQLRQRGDEVKQVTIHLDSKKMTLVADDGTALLPVSPATPLTLPQGTVIQASLLDKSLDDVATPNDVLFTVSFTLQGVPVTGVVPLRGLEVAHFTIAKNFTSEPSVQPQWLYQVLLNGSGEGYRLPSDPLVGDSVLLPRAFQEAGILAGDRGYLSYYTPTPSSIQEQRLPVYVAGFYDPGMIPLGGKMIFVTPSITTMIRSAYGQLDKDNGNGIRVRFADPTQADQVKARLEQAFKQRGIERYWNIETFRNYEFAKEILQQQRSDKNLFMVIACVIMIVACSNIISMLIILVNDKKVEIGILRSMGASSRSIAAIFGICGFVMGTLGSLIGILAAVVTLHHLDALISLIGQLQGYQMFNPTFYGQSMPNELSLEALSFVLAATATFSLLAGIVPAIKASLLKPSAILRAE